MNKIKELMEQLRENSHLAKQINDTPGPNLDKLIWVLNERIKIINSAISEHNRLFALANELQLIVEPKYKELLEEVVWEKLQQIEMTKQEIEPIKREIKHLEEIGKVFDGKKKNNESFK